MMGMHWCASPKHTEIVQDLSEQQGSSFESRDVSVDVRDEVVDMRQQARVRELRDVSLLRLAHTHTRDTHTPKNLLII